MYNNMEILYRKMERLYRNQHFYYQRNRAHKENLAEMELKMKMMKLWKVGVLVLCGVLQFFIVRRMIDRKNPVNGYNSVPTV